MAERTEKIPRYFAAANSADGFCSFYDTVFADKTYERVCAIKGGPGTGKSQLMKEACRKGQTAGYECEQILCSSDPFSLDGVILIKGSRRLALFDGTAPHIRESDLPGACGSLFDLGAFWDPTLLAGLRDEIEEHVREKQAAYRAAYRFLSAAGVHERHRLSLLGECVDREKLHRFTARLIPSGEKTVPPDREIRLRRAISMKGAFETDCYQTESGTRFSVYGAHGASALFFDALEKTAREKSQRVRLSPAPLLTDTYDALSLPDCRLSFFDSGKTPDPAADRRLNCERFLLDAPLRRVKPLLRRLAGLRDDAIRAAYDALKQADAAHAILERIYGDAMDFSGKEEAQERFLARFLEDF